MNAMVEAPNLSEAVGQTTDAALMQIVTLLDSLAYRPGELGQVLTHALPRLRTLRPARPWKLSRLLFTPVEGIIVPDTEAGVFAGTLPRAVLGPIARAVRSALGDMGDAIESELAALPPTDTTAARALGTMLWSEAAYRASSLRTPDQDTISDSEFRAAVALCVAGWRHGAALWPMLDQAPELPAASALRDLLARAAADRAALPVVLATLLHRSSRPGSLAAMGRELGPEVEAAIETALDRWIERSVSDAQLSTPSLAEETLARFAAAAEDLEQAGWLASNARRIRTGHVRARIEQALGAPQTAEAPQQAEAPEDGKIGSLRRRLFCGKNEAGLFRRRVRDAGKAES